MVLGAINLKSITSCMFVPQLEYKRSFRIKGLNLILVGIIGLNSIFLVASTVYGPIDTKLEMQRFCQNEQVRVRLGLETPIGTMLVLYN